MLRERFSGFRDFGNSGFPHYRVETSGFRTGMVMVGYIGVTAGVQAAGVESRTAFTSATPIARTTATTTTALPLRVYCHHHATTAVAATNKYCY